MLVQRNKPSYNIVKEKAANMTNGRFSVFSNQLGRVDNKRDMKLSYFLELRLVEARLVVDVALGSTATLLAPKQTLHSLQCYSICRSIKQQYYHKACCVQYEPLPSFYFFVRLHVSMLSGFDLCVSVANATKYSGQPGRQLLNQAATTEFGQRKKIHCQAEYTCMLHHWHKHLSQW